MPIARIDPASKVALAPFRRICIKVIFDKAGFSGDAIDWPVQRRLRKSQGRASHNQRAPDKCRP
jgi:hypothetical protein